jgi:hypothetical protein
MSLIDSIQSATTESIYKGYMKLMELNAPYRMAIIIAILGFSTPYILKFVLFVLRKFVSMFTAFFTSSQHKMGELVVKRRTNGKNPIFGTGIIDTLLSLFLLIFTKINSLLTKKIVFPFARKKYILGIVACAFILPLLGLLSPEGVVGKNWTKWEGKLINEHLVTLGYNPSTYKSFALYSAELAAIIEEKNADPAEASTQGAEEYLTPAENAKNGVFIRSAANGDSNDVGLLPYGEKALYLKEKQLSPSGITWYKVRTNSNITGWVSAKFIRQATD